MDFRHSNNPVPFSNYDKKVKQKTNADSADGQVDLLVSRLIEMVGKEKILKMLFDIEGLLKENDFGSICVVLPEDLDGG